MSQYEPTLFNSVPDVESEHEFDYDVVSRHTEGFPTSTDAQVDRLRESMQAMKVREEEDDLVDQMVAGQAQKAEENDEDARARQKDEVLEFVDIDLELLGLHAESLEHPDVITHFNYNPGWEKLTPETYAIVDKEITIRAQTMVGYCLVGQDVTRFEGELEGDTNMWFLPQNLTEKELFFVFVTSRTAAQLVYEWAATFDDWANMLTITTRIHDALQVVFRLWKDLKSPTRGAYVCNCHRQLWPMEISQKRISRSDTVELSDKCVCSQCDTSEEEEEEGQEEGEEQKTTTATEKEKQQDSFDSEF